MRSWTRRVVRLSLWAVVLAGMAAAVPWAAAGEGQDAPDDEALVGQQEEETAGGDQEDQVDAEGWPERAELKRVMRLQKLMRQQLDLRDQQVRRINALFEEHLEALRQHARSAARARSENAARIKEIREQLVAASRERDRQTIRALSRELRELRGGRAGLRQLQASFQEAILEELDEQQAQKFRVLFRRIMNPRRDLREITREIQVIRWALSAAGPSLEQQKATQQYWARLRDVQAKAREGDSEAATEALAEIREAILGELNEDQVARFRDAEEELRKDAERRPRPGGRKPLRDLPRRPLKTDQGADREEERGTGAEED